MPEIGTPKGGNNLCQENRKQFQEMMNATFPNMGDYFPFKQDETNPAPSQETHPPKAPKSPPAHPGKTGKQETPYNFKAGQQWLCFFYP